MIDPQYATHPTVISPMWFRMSKFWYRSSTDDVIQHFTAISLLGLQLLYLHIVLPSNIPRPTRSFS